MIESEELINNEVEKFQEFLDAEYEKLDDLLCKSGKCIRIPIDTYVDLLSDRRAYIEHNFGWIVNDLLWIYFIRQLLSGEIELTGTHTEPAYVVDNLANNADCGDFDRYKRDLNQSDEDFIKQWEKNARYIDKKHRFIIMNLGI